MAQKWPFFMCR